jgi:hypothetical protein
MAAQAAQLTNFGIYILMPGEFLNGRSVFYKTGEAGYADMYLYFSAYDTWYISSTRSGDWYSIYAPGSFQAHNPGDASSWSYFDDASSALVPDGVTVTCMPFSIPPSPPVSVCYVEANTGEAQKAEGSRLGIYSLAPDLIANSRPIFQNHAGYYLFLNTNGIWGVYNHYIQPEYHYLAGDGSGDLPSATSWRWYDPSTQSWKDGINVVCSLAPPLPPDFPPQPPALPPILPPPPSPQMHPPVMPPRSPPSPRLPPPLSPVPNISPLSPQMLLEVVSQIPIYRTSLTALVIACGASAFLGIAAAGSMLLFLRRRRRNARPRTSTSSDEIITSPMTSGVAMATINIDIGLNEAALAAADGASPVSSIPNTHEPKACA